VPASGSERVADTEISAGLAGRAAEAIRRQIRERALRPGDVIATEGALAQTLGVSRNAIREAVGRLRGLGLVDSRQSKGLVVAQSDPAEVMRLVLPHYAVDQTSMTDLAELRYCIEMGAVEMAVGRASDEQVHKLVELGKAFEALVTRDQVEADRVDQTFHETILAATGNRLLQDMHVVITGFFQRAPAELDGWYLGKEPRAWEHLAIADAFAGRDAERARVLLAGHLHRGLVGRSRHGADGQQTKEKT